MTSIVDASVFDVIAEQAAAESPLWAGALRARDERIARPVFSLLVPDPALAIGVETIYEGYLVHYGRPRLFAPSDADTALLLGDYLYAHGLVHVAETGNVEAVRDLAELISLCAQARADARSGEAEAWAATAALLGSGELADARASLRDRGDTADLVDAAVVVAGAGAVRRALDAHRGLADEHDDAASPRARFDECAGSGGGDAPSGRVR
jgi:hypothetical protein